MEQKQWSFIHKGRSRRTTFINTPGVELTEDEVAVRLATAMQELRIPADRAASLMGISPRALEQLIARHVTIIAPPVPPDGVYTDGELLSEEVNVAKPFEPFKRYERIYTGRCSLSPLNAKPLSKRQWDELASRALKKSGRKDPRVSFLRVESLGNGLAR